MRKKIKKVIPAAKKVIPKENLLGFESVDELYKQLLEKSEFVFPEYKNVVARRGISRHTANLIVSGVCPNKKFVDLYGKNGRVFYHLKKLAEKGFASYVNGKRKGQIELNMEKIKTWWLNANRPITEEEFENAAIARIDNSIKNISQRVHKITSRRGILATLSNVASNLEMLEIELDGCMSNDKKTN